MRTGLECPSDPALAVEWSAFANLAKFAIRSDATNQDYACDFEKLSVSLSYVKADLEVLDARFGLIPRTMLDTLR